MTVTYKEKLKDPRWQKKRLQILQRDDFTCQICLAKDRELQVHHLVYAKRDPWDYPDHLYQTLCTDCHELRQELSDKASNALRIALRDIPTGRMEAVAKKLCSEAMDGL